MNKLTKKWYDEVKGAKYDKENLSGKENPVTEDEEHMINNTNNNRKKKAPNKVHFKINKAETNIIFESESDTE